MKTKFRQQNLWKNIFCTLLITFHIRFGLCRPSLSNVDTQNNLQNRDLQNAQGHHTPVRPTYDLKNMDRNNIPAMHGNSAVKNNGTLEFYSEKDFVDYLSNDVSFIGGIEVGNDAFDDDTTPTRDDVKRYVIADKEGSILRLQEGPFTDRNLVRKRRQPEQHKPHRRRRRKHRLVLKARDRNHLSDGENNIKDRRDRFLIKSDSPAYVITSASEVKKDWCKTIPLRQKISEPNCRSKTVENNFCYGQCNSFFIPHTDRTDNKVAFQSCAFCKPLRQHWGNVTLNCPGRNPPKVEKTVLFVDACRCITEVFQ